MSNKIGFTVQVGPATESPAKTANTPLKVLFFGNFSGHPGKPAAPVRVTTDNLSQVFSSMRPSVKLQSLANLTIALKNSEGFHPDHVIGQIPGAERLLSLRRRLQNASTFESAKAELTQFGDAPAAGHEAGTSESGDTSDFDSLLGSDASSPLQRDSKQAKSAVETMVADIVRRHVTPALGDQQATLIAAVDDALSDLLRPVLHAEEFQSLEANWLDIESVTTAVFEEDQIQIYLCDIDPASVKDSDVLEKLGEAIMPAATDSPWSVFVVADYFGATQDDIALLEHWASLAQFSHAALLAGAAPAIVGLESFESTPQENLAVPEDIDELWESFRNSQNAKNVGLAAPRLLQRQPYGEGSDEIDSFNFEELKPRPTHDTFLWGNPACAITRSIVEAFQEQGWKFAQHMEQDISDLPLAIYNDGSGKAIKPAGECLLSERQAGELVEQGIIPILSYRDRNAAKWMQFRSVGHDAGTPASLGT